MIANRDPNHFRLFFKRPLKLKVGDTSLRLPIGSTVKLAVAWSIWDGDSTNTPSNQLRAEKSGNLPKWKDFKILDVAGSPQEATDIIQVQNST